MTLPRTVREILAEHTTLEVESIDRMYLNVYVPPLQYDGGVATFFRKHRGQPFASSVLMAPISRAFIAAIEAFVAAQRVPLITFEKGQRKDDVMAAHLARFTGSEGVLFVGKAQEKATVFRTEKRRNPRTGQPYPWLVRSTAMVNQYYFYAVDRDFGPFFLKFCSYFPYNAKLCLNGHEYLKRQLTQRGIAYEALDNGLWSCAAPAAMQRVADGLSAAKIEALLHKWFGRLPHPFAPGDRRAGYRYRCSILQSEFSLTQALDQPVMGRLFFEEVIRENLDPRPPGPGAVDLRASGEPADARAVSHPRDYRGGHPVAAHRLQAQPDQAVPQGRPGTPDGDDNQRPARLRHPQRAVSPLRAAEGRLPGQSTSARRPTDQPRLRDGRSGGRGPVPPRDGRRAAGGGLAVGRSRGPGPVPRADRLSPGAAAGWRQRDLRAPLAALLGGPPAAVSTGRMTYQLRRLRLHGLIERRPGTHRYHVTDRGLRIALFFTRVHARLFRPGLAAVMPEAVRDDSRLRRAFDQLERAMDQWCAEAKLAA